MLRPDSLLAQYFLGFVTVQVEGVWRRAGDEKILLEYKAGSEFAKLMNDKCAICSKEKFDRGEDVVFDAQENAHVVTALVIRWLKVQVEVTTMISDV